MALLLVTIISVLRISGILAEDPPFPFLYGNHGDKYLGCYSDYVLNINHQLISSNMTIEMCLDTCSQRNESYAALSYSASCWCVSIDSGSLISYSEKSCYQDDADTCTGNPLQICGSVYDLVSLYCVHTSGCAVLERQDLSRCRSCSPCERRYGKCIGNCSADQYGPFCLTSCPRNYHGADCEHWCGGCQENRCNNVTGVCTDGCKPHFRGDACQYCVEGWNGTYCDHEIIPTCKDYHQYFKGQCVDCVDGFYGQACDMCPATCRNGLCEFSGKCLGCSDGFYGDVCDQKCPLNCSQCDQNVGMCTACNAGYYGETCEIPCDKHCMTCNFVFGGCESCKPGYYGKDCDILCPALCKQRQCDSKEGTCLNCLDGYYGSRCDIPCSNCHACDKRNGICLSDCQLGWFGGNCDQLCPNDCAVGACQKQTGSCLSCAAGSSGSKCESNEGTGGEKLTSLYAVIGVISVVLLGLLGLTIAFVVMVVIPRYKASKQDSDCGLSTSQQVVAGGASVEVYENIEGIEMVERSVTSSGLQQMASFSTPISHDSTTSTTAASQHKTEKQNEQRPNPSTPTTRPLPQKPRLTLSPKPTTHTPYPVALTAKAADLSTNQAVANAKYEYMDMPGERRMGPQASASDTQDALDGNAGGNAGVYDEAELVRPTPFLNLTTQTSNPAASTANTAALTTNQAVAGAKYGYMDMSGARKMGSQASVSGTQGALDGNAGIYDELDLDDIDTMPRFTII